MELRFTLSNSTEGSQVISNPDGWQDIKVKLERDPKFHSLVEKIEVPLIFYRSNGIVDGGYDYIKNIEETQGINAIINILIEISEDEGTTFETFFEGNLDLSDIEEFSEGDAFYTLKCPILQTSLWSKFFNRIETPVDLQSTNDLDGNLTQIITPIEVSLLGQTLTERYDGSVTPTRAFHLQDDLENNPYIQIDFSDNVILDELSTNRIPIASVAAIEDIAETFTPINNGSYYFDIRVEAARLLVEPTGSDCLGYSIDSYDYAIQDPDLSIIGLRLYFKVNNESPVEFGAVNVDAFNTELGVNVQSTVYTFTGTYNLLANDRVYIYGHFIYNALSDDDADILGVNNLLFFGESSDDVNFTKGIFHKDIVCILDDTEGVSDNLILAPSGEGMPSRLQITGNTTYPDSTTDALLIHDTFKAIVNRITGQFPSFYSERLGRITQGYETDGCNSAYALMKGLHVRGYSFDDKPFFQSFKDAWDGADPIFNLGVGYEDVPEVDEGYDFNFDFNEDFNS